MNNTSDSTMLYVDLLSKFKDDPESFNQVIDLSDILNA